MSVYNDYFKSQQVVTENTNFVLFEQWREFVNASRLEAQQLVAKALFTDKAAQTHSQNRADRACTLSRAFDTARRHTFHSLESTLLGNFM